MNVQRPALPPIAPPRAAAPAGAVLAGALLGMALATCTPGVIFVAGLMDSLHGQTLAAGFHGALAAWGALTGALVVRERLGGGGRAFAGGKWTLLLVPIHSGIVLAVGLLYTFRESAQGGRDAFAALILLAGVSLAVAAASLPIAVGTWLLVRSLASRLVADAAAFDDRDARVCRRASWWVLAAAGAQIATGVAGGPVLFGIAAAVGAAWLFARSRANVVVGMVGGALLALLGAGAQLFWWGIQGDEQQRAALPHCGDAGSDPASPGAYGARARAVPGVVDATALLGLDKSKFPAVVYTVQVTVVATSDDRAPDVRRAVAQALVGVDCDEGQQLRRVPPNVVAPPERPLDIDARVRLRPGATADTVRAELDAKLRATLPHTPLSTTGIRLALPSALDLTGVESVTWQVNGSPYASGASLPFMDDVEMPVLRTLTVQASAP